MSVDDIAGYLAGFRFGGEGATPAKTQVENIDVHGTEVKRFVNEFWTSKQRKASSLHEVSYRACFKPQLPRFFIDLMTSPGDVVYDPFSGRGTTGIEAALLGRNVILNDVNPLSEILSRPRLSVPTVDEVKTRLERIPGKGDTEAEIDLSMFFHPRTLDEILALKGYLEGCKESGKEDDVDRWIRMVATNRLTGHSPGFFSVYTLPPNQATSPERQVKINKKRGQVPEYRDTHKLILKKTRTLTKDVTPEIRNRLGGIGQNARFLCTDARNTKEIGDESVQLTVTSPPFLNIVQYSKDNWLRCWFNSLDAGKIEKGITMSRTLEAWTGVMGRAFEEFHRITKPGGWVAFEVGEIRSGRIRLDEHVVPLGILAGFDCAGILVNLQKFTKTSNIWGVNNMQAGTNTNRVVLFRRS